MMKAIPMKGRLRGKRIRGYMWAGRGSNWTKKENYFQLEDEKIVTAVLDTDNGTFWVRCRGLKCEITLYGKRGRVQAKTTLAFPKART